ncbi:MAG: hypothetical protein JW748_05365 [Anaerolineales bacterium]|nr:hypothetical protein [Anaerolineales bacterium]
MADAVETLFGTRIRHAAIRTGFAAAAMIALGLLAGCSGAAPGTPEGAAPPIGGLDSTAPADAMGVYPPPVGGVGATADPKALPKAAGTNAVYLPAIINEKPPTYPFDIQQTGVLAVQGFFGCNWSGVAGQVFDQSGAPLQNLILHLEGFWNGSAVASEVLSGSAGHYGPAGYEFILGTQTLDSTQTVWIQVQDAAHKQLSPRVYLNTYNDCARNLILVNFVQVR